MERDRDIRDLKGVKICAIGSKTASAIKKYGIKVDLVPKKFNAEGLIEAFTKEHRHNSPRSPFNNGGGSNPPIHPLEKGGKGAFESTEPLKRPKLLLPRAEVAREVFPQKVRELVGDIDVYTAYKTVKPEVHGKRLKRFLKEGKITIATFTSAATFNNFMEIMGEDAIDLLKDVTIAVIGPVTAKAVGKAGLKVSIMPKEATVDAMVKKIIDWVTKKKS